MPLALCPLKRSFESPFEEKPVVALPNLQGTMMDLSHSLVLNEEALAQIPEQKRPVFIFEWLRFLDKVLVAAQKVSHPIQ
ncbi:unnamed protein product [Nezara viridula]|uniref:Uncharacterized protein n=1 Tax=Nezara viridula TaxID=85310 RepID=A0A9P0HHK0_NEZVI|nr:unnamed protein product [Nezara viridula]